MLRSGVHSLVHPLLPVGSDTAELCPASHRLRSFSRSTIERDAILNPAHSIAADPIRAFLIACLAGRRQAEALETARDLAHAPDFDWAAVHRSAVQELLAPLLYGTLQGRDLLPPELEAIWRGLYAGSMQRNLLLLRELDAVLAALDAAGVEVMLLKGAALVRTVYDDAGLRPMNDIDLLLHEADAPAALRQLAALGYATDAPFTYFGEVAAHKQGALTSDVDLHWSLIGLPHYRERIAPDWLWQTSRPVAGGAAPARVLGPEAQLLHLCAHPALQHANQEPRLLWLHDVAEVLHHDRGDAAHRSIDWADLLQKAQDCDLLLPLQQVLPLVAETWGAPLPGPVLERLARLVPSAQERKLHRWYTAAPWSGIESSWVSLAGLPDWRSRLRYLWANIFPPAAYMRGRYDVRHQVFLPIYYVKHWLAGLSGGFTLAAGLVRRRARLPG